ncbi:MAG: DUF2264 domain-containing protein [Bryobacteraceae bacterium]
MNSSRRAFLQGTAAAALPLAAVEATPQQGGSDREYWVSLVKRIAEPVLTSLSERKLKASMPVEASHGNTDDRRKYSHLEALGRLLTGISPWIESGDTAGSEGKLRARYSELARRSIAAAVDPKSPDHMNFDSGSQPVVDAAFLALGILRAPKELWEKLDPTTKTQVIRAMQASRVIKPGFNNWLLFSATVEAFLGFAGERPDSMRIDYAVREHEAWYKGDGVYGDGPQFHWDYYNSFVIQPMLLQVLESARHWSSAWESFYPAVLARARRYAVIQERLISPEGTFPAIGRSLAYRFGAFHLLSTVALRKELPEGLAPEQVRSALTTVIRRMSEAPGTFDKNGWLQIGFCGHQPSIAEAYISTGSLYLCSAVFLPLGLASSDPFWTGPETPWTAKQTWDGKNVPADHALQS